MQEGERLSLTVNRTPVADIVPHGREQRSPWVSSATLRRIVEETPVDAAVLDDLADVRADEIDEQ